jgi:cellulose synthase/poly-beta-1,6-N-acetylglucosamine synthase-like glycosyltransferase
LIYLAYTGVLFYVLRFCVATVKIIFSPVLKKRTPQSTPLVSVLIPARNEEENIVTILNDLKEQSYQNIEVAVFNDQSTDNTANIVKSFSETDKRFRMI